jgi:hypothetical protein
MSTHVPHLRRALLAACCGVLVCALLCAGCGEGGNGDGNGDHTSAQQSGTPCEVVFGALMDTATRCGFPDQSPGRTAICAMIDANGITLTQAQDRADGLAASTCEQLDGMHVYDPPGCDHILYQAD